jgi:hypothetical protein
MSKAINDRLKRLDLFVKQIKSDAPAQIGESVHARKERVQYLLDKKNWPKAMKYYFPNWVKSEFAPFHIRGGNAVLNFTQKKNVFVWEIARNMSKTTWWQMKAIMLNLRKISGLSHGYDAGIWWSKTFDQASESLTSIRLQFEHNPKLKQDFGEFKSFGQWDEKSFTTSQGLYWKALGKGQSPRGSKKDEQRVNLFIGDDFDDDEEIRNQKRLDQSWEWFTDALMPVADVSDHALYVMLNNLIGKDSIQARAVKIADYHERVNLLDERGRPSWAARHSLEDCQYMINKIGTRAAQKEYFNNPLVEGKVFKEEWLQYKKVDNLGSYHALLAYLDPSFKSKKNADHKALVLIGAKDGEFHVIKVFCDVASVEEMIEWHYDLEAYVKAKGGICEFWMEEVFLQDLLYKDFAEVAKRKGWPIGVHGDTRKKPDKDARISSIAGYFERAQIFLNENEKDNHHMQRLREQLLLFEPGFTGIKKDGPDALEGGLFKIMEKIQTSQPTVIGKRSKSKNMY